jgi:hypothetical protein
MLFKTQFNVSPQVFNAAKDAVPTINSKLTLNQPTGDFFYDPWAITPEFKNTVWEEILDSLPFDKGEARLIELAPQQTYSGHADIDDRWHLALSGDQSYLIDLDGMKVHKTDADGSWYDMDAGRIHTAANFGGRLRIQLVVRKLLLKNNIDNSIQVTIDPAGDTTWHRYNFDLIFSPWLNRANKTGDISHFNFQGNSIKFNINPDALESFKSIVTSDFRIDYA